MKHLLTLLISGMSLWPNLNANAQTAMSQPSTVALNHVAVYVVDLEISTAFYRDVVQLSVIPEPFNDGMHSWFSMGGNSELHVISGSAEATAQNKHNHLCFSVASMDDFMLRLNKFEVPYSSWTGEANVITTRPDGIKQIYFQDPDGYWIEVNDAYPSN